MLRRSDSATISAFFGASILWYVFLQDITDHPYLNMIIVYLLGYITAISLNCNINKIKKEVNAR